MSIPERKKRQRLQDPPNPPMMPKPPRERVDMSDRKQQIQLAARTYSVFAPRPMEGVVGGVLIDHKSSRISCSVLVTRILDLATAKVKFEIRPSEGGVYTHELVVQPGAKAVADVSIKVPACAVKILADNACQDVYVTITAYPEA